MTSRSSTSSGSAQTPTLKLDWTLSAKQLAFVEDETTLNLCYGGARGGGKSFVVRVKAIILAYKYPGITQLIVRQTLDELRKNHIIPLLNMLGKAVKYVKSEKTIYFPNGSKILLGYFDSDADEGRYRGLENDVIYIEEATLLKQEWIQVLTATVRGVNDFPKQVCWTTNPGGPSHQYIKRLFIDRVYEPTEDPTHYAFIQALVTDNRALLRANPNYYKTLLALPYKLRRAWLNGDWSVVEGMFFEDFVDRPDMYAERRHTHVIPAEGFYVPRHWKIYGSFDWGYNRPFSALYFAVSEDDVVYLIAEYYGVKRAQGMVQANEGVRWTREKVFSELRRFELEHPLMAGRKIDYRVADPAIWDAQYGESTADIAAKYGVHYIRGDHARIPGWLQCHYRLQFDDEGYPRFYVLDSCRDFIRTIPTLVYDEHNAEDLDSDGEDHAADAWRYFLMSRPIKPIIKETPQMPAYGINPLNQGFRR